MNREDLKQLQNFVDRIPPLKAALDKISDAELAGFWEENRTGNLEVDVASTAFHVALLDKGVGFDSAKIHARGLGYYAMHPEAENEVMIHYLKGLGEFGQQVIEISETPIDGDPEVFRAITELLET